MESSIHLPILQQPTLLVSQATYEWLGLDSDTATDLWHMFDGDGESSFIDQLHTVLETSNLKFLQGPCPHGWDDYMRQAGLAWWLRRAILAPDFADLRATSNGLHWVTEAITARWEYLKHVLGHKSDPDFPYCHEQALRLHQTQDFPAPAALPGYTMLYKDLDLERAKSVYDPASATLTLENALHINHSGDFSPGTHVYWTPMRPLAQRFQAWSKLKTLDIPQAILQIAIPNHYLESLKTLRLTLDKCSDPAFPSSTLRRLAFHSHNFDADPKLPSIAKYQLITGPVIAGQSSRNFQSPMAIQHQHLLMVETAPGRQEQALQWLFPHLEEEEDLQTYCASHCWIHELGAPTT